MNNRSRTYTCFRTLVLRLFTIFNVSLAQCELFCVNPKQNPCKTDKRTAESTTANKQTNHKQNKNKQTKNNPQIILNIHNRASKRSIKGGKSMKLLRVNDELSFVFPCE